MKVVSPSTVSRARIGTEINECSPNSRIRAARSGCSTAHPWLSGSSTGSRTGAPDSRKSASCGGGTKSTASPTRTTASGQPSRTELMPARRMAGRSPSAGVADPGRSPPNGASSRSTKTKSANRGTAKSASSCAVRCTSRVEPMLAPASLTSASSRRAFHRSVTSRTM
ncbi:hypothetical protein SBADM41S_00358 [Streptomyces badius]